MGRTPTIAIDASTFDETREVLDQPLWYECWRRDFDVSAAHSGAPDLEVATGQTLARQCASLRFPDSAIDDIVSQRETFRDPRLERLAAHVHWLLAERYAPGRVLDLGWPPPPAACPLFYVFAALGLAARIAVRHRALGISPEITADTLWDIGQQVWLHRDIHGAVGMNKGWWLSHHLASHLFRLGRLQFQRGRARPGLGPVPEGEAILDVHIPEDGPFPPSACEASFEAARQLFPRVFPEDGAAWFTCDSWLLDPALAGLLPDGCNILHFQRRFELVEEAEDRAAQVFEFVFHRPDLDATEDRDLSELPRRTLLERALLDHYEAGGTIDTRLGVIAIGSVGMS